MPIRAQLIVVALALILLVSVARLVRRSTLRDTYALTWVAVSALTVVVTLIPASVWDRVALAVGIQSGAPTLFLVLGVFGLTMLILQLGIALTRVERLVTTSIIRDSVREAISSTDPPNH